MTTDNTSGTSESQAAETEEIPAANSEDVAAARAFKIRLHRPHPLIAKMLESEPKPNAYGYAPPRNFVPIDVQVSKPQRRVALAVMDRLFKALDAKDIKIEVTNSYEGHGTYAVRGQDKAKISISEEYKKAPHEPTAQELRQKDEVFARRIPKWDNVPTGKMTLNPGGPVDLSSEEALEKLIEKSVADIEEGIAVARGRREANEEHQRKEWQRQKVEQEEKSRVEALGNAAKSLREYRLLMEYIEEVRRFGRVPDNQRKEGQSLEEWIRWAEWRARQIHPLG